MTTITATNKNGDTVRLQIDGNTVRAIYDDALVDVLPKIGDVSVARASRVEPASTVSHGTEGWIADMSPSGGQVLTSDGKGGYYESLPPFLDGRPFKTRAEALAAERAWLRAHKGL